MNMVNFRQNQALCWTIQKKATTSASLAKWQIQIQAFWMLKFWIPPKLPQQQSPTPLWAVPLLYSRVVPYATQAIITTIVVARCKGLSTRMPRPNLRNTLWLAEPASVPHRRPKMRLCRRVLSRIWADEHRINSSVKISLAYSSLVARPPNKSLTSTWLCSRPTTSRSPCSTLALRNWISTSPKPMWLRLRKQVALRTKLVAPISKPYNCSKSLFKKVISNITKEVTLHPWKVNLLKGLPSLCFYNNQLLLWCLDKFKLNRANSNKIA